MSDIMKLSIVIFILISQILFCATNAKMVQKRWARDEWSTLRDRWRQIGEDFKMKADSSREWFKDRFNSGSAFSSVSHFRPLFEDFPSNTNSQKFDPSVVIIDKPEKEQQQNPFSSPFEFEFSSQMGFNEPKFWPLGSLFKTQRSWWTGPNVCIERRIIEGTEPISETKSDVLQIKQKNSSQLSRSQMLFSLQSTHCSESDTSYTCITKMLRGRENKTTIVKYQCCHGFNRNSNSGCTQVDLKGLVQTMKDLKTNRMLQLIERLGFYDKLNSENLTIFSPTDEALVEYQDDLSNLENEIEAEVVPAVVRRRRETDDKMLEIILMHIIPGFVKSGDFDDEQRLSSLSNLRKNIRINVYNNPKRVVTANCARIISANNYATNGIIHILDRVMQMPNNTILDLINRDSRFKIMRNLISNTNLLTTLQDNGQHMTFFVPTDDAFSRLDETYLNRLLAGQACVETFIKNHLTPNILCSSAIQNYAQIKNSLDLVLNIKRDEEKLQVDGIRVLETDKLATNGVIHVIDGVMISEQSQPISNFLETHQMGEYMDLIKNAGLLTEWDSMTNVSFFVPSIDAIRSLSPLRLEEIKNKSKEIMQFHVAVPKSESCDWNNNQMLKTTNGNDIRINTFGDIPGFNMRSVSTAQCARIIGPNDNICGSNVHIVDRFLMPPNGNLTEVLDSMEKFTIIRRIIKNSGLEVELEKGLFTLLAPNDDTFFRELSEKELNLLINDAEEAEKFSRLHLLPEVICCSGVNTSPLFISLQQIGTLDGSLISAHKTLNGRVRFGNTKVTECDLMATNGVIHVINKVLNIEPSIVTSLRLPLFEMLF